MTPDSDKEKILIFTREDNLLLLADAAVYYCDGTFDKFPAVFTNMYTLYVFAEGTMCPLVYGQLPNNIWENRWKINKFCENMC